MKTTSRWERAVARLDAAVTEVAHAARTLADEAAPFKGAVSFLVDGDNLRDLRQAIDVLPAHATFLLNDDGTSCATFRPDGSVTLETLADVGGGQRERVRLILSPDASVRLMLELLSRRVLGAESNAQATERVLAERK